MTAMASHEDHALARSLHRQLARCGGFTLDRRSHRPLTAGVSVGADPGATLRVPWLQWDHHLVAGWVRCHRDRRRLDDLHLGGWLDPHRGDVWLDLVRVFPEDAREEALQVGLRHRQRAVFDIGAKTIWYLTGLPTTGLLVGVDPVGLHGVTGGTT